MKVKCKGLFEWEDLEQHKPSHLHKNKSFLIVPKALYAFFVDNILPEQYLQDNRNIFDYCAGAKAKGGWNFQIKCITSGQYSDESLQKTIRYYISNSGCKIIKKHNDNREIQTEAGIWVQTLFNQYIEKPWVEYDVNDKYYLDAIYQEISNINPVKTQLELFN